MCNRAAKRVELHVIRETAPSVDLDDREPLAILGLERVVAGDVDLPQLEAELWLQLPNLSKRALAEVAALRVVDDDVGRYG